MGICASFNKRNNNLKNNYILPISSLNPHIDDIHKSQKYNSYDYYEVPYERTISVEKECSMLYSII